MWWRVLKIDNPSVLGWRHYRVQVTIPGDAEKVQQPVLWSVFEPATHRMTQALPLEPSFWVLPDLFTGKSGMNTIPASQYWHQKLRVLGFWCQCFPLSAYRCIPLQQPVTFITIPKRLSPVIHGNYFCGERWEVPIYAMTAHRGA